MGKDWDKLYNILPAGRADTLTVLEETESTNKVLAQMARQGAKSGQTVIAAKQTAGKGRSGKSFLSPEGGLYLSYLICPQSENFDTTFVTAYAAVAVCLAVKKVCGINPQIKWVNDLVLGAKKICGILAESASDAKGNIDRVIIGIGLNVKHCEFVSPVNGIAGCLNDFLDKAADFYALAAEIILQLDLIAGESGNKSKYLRYYRNNCITVGKKVKVCAGNEEYTGKAQKIDRNFRLVVRTDNGSKKTVSAGEVSVRGLYGYTT